MSFHEDLLCGLFSQPVFVNRSRPQVVAFGFFVCKELQERAEPEMVPYSDCLLFVAGCVGPTRSLEFLKRSLLYGR
ncbi:hypothetical protein KFK09_004802 [Dendrobium nobile]|uniref:Uncharacterized protein n=1 Tax=Dendrobium nobile TaxID=94219 RepID=A0A8T3BYT3_DENNO|nr:hypothetical protein KFK09_004802 [Dendrobium nobile]